MGVSSHAPPWSSSLLPHYYCPSITLVHKVRACSCVTLAIAEKAHRVSVSCPRSVSDSSWLSSERRPRSDSAETTTVHPGSLSHEGGFAASSAREGAEPSFLPSIVASSPPASSAVSSTPAGSPPDGARGAKWVDDLLPKMEKLTSSFLSARQPTRWPKSPVLARRWPGSSTL